MTADTKALASGEARRRLERLVAEECAQPVNPDAAVLVRELARNPGTAAVVFYGSGLWDKAGADTMYDFYVLVDRFRDWSPARLPAMAGNLLAPNVYYLEVRTETAVVRCKYAVMRLSQFRKAARGGSFTPQIWARFCQPCRVPHVRDERVKAFLIGALADAVVTFHERTLPLVEEPPIEGFWEAGLRATYAAEIRSEKSGRAAKLVASSRGCFEERTRLALPLCGTRAWLTQEETVASTLGSGAKRWRRFWRAVKRPVQKAVPLGRLIKGAFTFNGGIDYLRWKIERHSGVVIPPSEFQRRHPVLAGLLLLWKVRRRGGIR